MFLPAHRHQVGLAQDLRLSQFTLQIGALQRSIDSSVEPEVVDRQFLNEWRIVRVFHLLYMMNIKVIRL
jgi:hypothetical protein